MYSVLSNFKFGLDARRSELTLQPGALLELRNGHINQGAEIEKRKAFVRYLLPTSFGLEATADGIVVFGSAIDPGGWPTNVTYQRLLHPFSEAAQLTQIIFSTVYSGKVFAIAKFEEGSVFAYYDGAAISDFYGGEVTALMGGTGYIVAAHLANLVNNNTDLYTAINFNIGGGTGLLRLFSLPGGRYTVNITKNSALGTIVSQLIGTGTPGTVAVIATGSFQIIAGSAGVGNQVTQIAVGATNLLTGVVAFTATIETTAAAVVTAINANSNISGYRASASGSVVTIYSTTASATPNGKAVVVTSAGNVCIGKCVFSITGTGFTLDYVNVNSVNVLSAVLTFPTPANETLSAFCARAVTSINAGTGTHGYVAYSVSNVIYLSKAVTSSTDNPLTVEVGITGSGVAYLGSNVPIYATISNTSAPFSLINFNLAITTPITVSPVGGVPPYKYGWPEVVDSNQQASLTSTVPNGQTTQFRYYYSGFSGPPLSGTYAVKCTITDALGNVVESPEVRMVIPRLS